MIHVLDQTTSESDPTLKIAQNDSQVGQYHQVVKHPARNRRDNVIAQVPSDNNFGCIDQFQQRENV
jgi:hypothetical protein